jgi:hypothetical protein
LEFKSLVLVKKRISKKSVVIAVVATFMFVTGVGMLTGNWQNDLTKEEYLLHYNYMGSYGHPTGAEGFRELNKQSLEKPDKDVKSNSTVR